MDRKHLACRRHPVTVSPTPSHSLCALKLSHLASGPELCWLSFQCMDTLKLCSPELPWSHGVDMKECA